MPGIANRVIRRLAKVVTAILNPCRCPCRGRIEYAELVLEHINGEEAPRAVKKIDPRATDMATPERYVIDTNVLVSFLLFYGSVPGQAVTKLENRGPAAVR